MKASAIRMRTLLGWHWGPTGSIQLARQHLAEAPTSLERDAVLASVLYTAYRSPWVRVFEKNPERLLLQAANTSRYIIAAHGSLQRMSWGQLITNATILRAAGEIRLALALLDELEYQTRRALDETPASRKKQAEGERVLMYLQYAQIAITGNRPIEAASLYTKAFEMLSSAGPGKQTRYYRDYAEFMWAQSHQSESGRDFARTSAWFSIRRAIFIALRHWQLDALYKCVGGIGQWVFTR